MGIRVGVICEGSHDYNVLEHIVSQIIREFGETLDAIKCLQPEVSATFQIGDGGWTQVKAWCERQDGQWYRKYLDKPLFASTRPFDVLIVHLDGDVAEHCNHPPLDTVSLDNEPVADIVSALRAAIRDHWLRLEPAHRPLVVACIPVRHLEAWLAAAIGPVLERYETVDMKGPFRAGPFRDLSGNVREKYVKAARAASLKLGPIRDACESYLTFETDLRDATEAA